MSSLGAMGKTNENPKAGNRIVVTGMAGAGKSTFSKALAAKTGLPLTHLDLHIWNPGWVRVPERDLLEKQRILLADESWIVDSNDVDEDLLIQRADTLFVLATPWWICSWRAFKRGVKRPRGSQLPQGCEESMLQRLTDEWGIVWRNWRNRNAVPARDLALASLCGDVMEVHILRTKQDTASLLSSI